MNIRAQLALLAMVAALLAGCKEETQVADSDFDTTGWVRHCLGYHSFLAPPDFTLGPQAATVDDISITVRPGSPAALRDVLADRDDYGRTLNAVEVNGWTVVVATIEDDLMESSYSLHLIGARRVGDDIVIGYRDISREDHPEGSDPALWSWFARTTPRLPATGDGLQGYCVEGVIFDSPHQPEPIARFSIGGGVRGPDTARGQPTIRSDTTLSLNIAHYPPEDLGDNRPLAPIPDISAMPGIDVEAERLSLGGREIGFTTVTFDDGNRSGTWYEAAIFSDPARPGSPALTTMKFQDGRSDEQEARAKALAILASIRPGR